ncbi:MAG: hypothetical protein DRI44_00650 [Chlamydiae bacterium]|nr:MAG: hypothetical protein DRI44_00650 [Chlamydiota bacterium]
MEEITPKEQFKKTLFKLSDQLKKVESVSIDDKTLKVLESVKSKTQNLIEETKHSETEKTFAEAIKHFEETHPDLTASLRDVVNMLNNIGI